MVEGGERGRGAMEKGKEKGRRKHVKKVEKKMKEIKERDVEKGSKMQKRKKK